MDATYTVDDRPFLEENEQDQGEPIEVKKTSGRKAKTTRKPKTSKKVISADEGDEDDPTPVSTEGEGAFVTGTGRDDTSGPEDLMKEDDKVTGAVDLLKSTATLQKTRKTYANRGRKAAAGESLLVVHLEEELGFEGEDDEIKDPTKRGRKPKAKPSVFDDVSETDANDLLITVAPEDLKVEEEDILQDVFKDRVRKGRKPKGRNPFPDDVTEDAASEDRPLVDPAEYRVDVIIKAEELVKNPGRKGRKPKAKTPPLDDAIETAASEDHPVSDPVETQPEDAATPSEILKNPARRGRKPRVKTPPLDDVTETAASEKGPVSDPVEDGAKDEVEPEDTADAPIRRGRNVKGKAAPLDYVVEPPVNKDRPFRNPAGFPTEDDEIAMERLIVKAPERRGRKPKTRIPATEEAQLNLSPIKDQPRGNDVLESENSSVKNPVRKGRKPKAAQGIPEDPDHIDSIKHQLEEMKIDEVAKVPAKRGRKPKTATKDTDEVKETAVQPTRRGRKPKEVPETETASGHSCDEASAKPLTRARRNVKPAESTAAKKDRPEAERNDHHQLGLEAPERPQRARRAVLPKN